MQSNELKKEYLRAYAPAFHAVKRMEEEIEQLRLGEMGAPLRIDDMPHGHNQSDLSDYVAKLDELESRMLRLRYERIQIYTQIFNDIECIEDEAEQAVLMYRYLRRLSWEQICVEMGYQWAQVHRIHARALKDLVPTGEYYRKLVENEKKIQDDTQ